MNTGDRVLPLVHIQLLKKFVQRESDPKVHRVTSVLDPDAESDDVADRYAEVQIRGDNIDEVKARDIASWEAEYSDILTKEPGITHLAEFTMNTGNHPPIFQRTYSIPTSLVESVDRELQWLCSKNNIKPSKSPWALPMVTVHKQDSSARLCVDFKAMNNITQPVPFYMPRVEEVLESVGKACVISKIDLMKGYYQVPMCPPNISKTAFTCHKGHFEFLRMPFGVKNASGFPGAYAGPV